LIINLSNNGQKNIFLILFINFLSFERREKNLNVTNYRGNKRTKKTILCSVIVKRSLNEKCTKNKFMNFFVILKGIIEKKMTKM